MSLSWGRGAGLSERLQAVRASVLDACVRAGRDPATVALLAASKAQPAEAVRAAYDAGQRLFGESYVQEWRAKAEHPLLVGLVDLRWHFIGALQRNKVRFLMGRVSCIESVGTRRLGQEISARSSAGGRATDVLLTVNVGEEGTKSGFLPDDLLDAARELHELHGLRLRGLMAIPPPEMDPALAHAEVAMLRDRVQDSLSVTLPTLSLGMSGDYAEAIAAGSTEIRVGTAIFGARPR